MVSLSTFQIISSFLHPHLNLCRVRSRTELDSSWFHFLHPNNIMQAWLLTLRLFQKLSFVGCKLQTDQSPVCPNCVLLMYPWNCHEHAWNFAWVCSGSSIFPKPIFIAIGRSLNDKSIWVSYVWKPQSK